MSRPTIWTSSPARSWKTPSIPTTAQCSLSPTTVILSTARLLLNYPGNNSESVPEKYMGNYDFYVEKSAQIGEKLLEDRIREGAETGASAGNRGDGPESGKGGSGAPGETGSGKKGSGKNASLSDPGTNPGAINPALKGSALKGSLQKGSVQNDPAQTSAASRGQMKTSSSAQGGVDDWKKRKEEQARRRKISNDLKKCEEEIARLEGEGEQLDNEISLPENSTDPERSHKRTSYGPLRTVGRAQRAGRRIRRIDIKNCGHR